MELTNKVILRERKVRIGFFIILHISILVILFLIPYVLISSILSIVTYYLLQPVVDLLENKGLNRNLAALIPFLGIALLIFTLASYFLPILTTQLDELQKLSPTYFENIKNLAIQFEKKAHPFLVFAGQANLTEQAQNFVIQKISSFMNQLPTYFSASLTTFFLTPFFSYFLLVDGSTLYRTFLKIVPNHIFETMIRVNHEINVQMGQFIRARLFESVIVGLIVYFGMITINFPYSLLLSIFAALMNLVPYVGPIIGALPSIALTMVSPEAHGNLGPVISIYVLSQVVDTVFILPFVVAKIVNLHPVVVVLAVMLGAQLLGITGMIISIPIMSALKIFTEALYKHLTSSKF